MISIYLDRFMFRFLFQLQNYEILSKKQENGEKM